MTAILLVGSQSIKSLLFGLAYPAQQEACQGSQFSVAYAPDTQSRAGLTVSLL
jgi:hypothetical protein